MAAYHPQTRPSMEGTIATLVLTRPLSAARRFARNVRAGGWPGAILFSPVMTIVPVSGTVIPAEGMLVFTSENGVRAAAAAGGGLAGRRAVAVGERTAALARRLGADCEAAGGDAERLAAVLVRRGGGPYVHCHGRHVTGDIVAQLGAAGIAASAVVVYDQIARPLGDAARAALAGPDPAVLPLFSPRSARLVARDLEAPMEATVIVALSEGVAAACPRGMPVVLAARPDAAAMADAVRGLVGWRGGR